MKVGFYQFFPLFGKNEENTKKIIATLEKVDVDLIVLPELALSGYHFNSPDEAVSLAEDPQHSPNIAALADLCHTKNMHIVLGFAERHQDHCFNSAALIGPQGVVHIYRKLHLFNEEKKSMRPGDIPLQINDIGGVKIGIMVCFDWAFPEVVRTLAMQGAALICQPANLVLDFCQQAMVTRSIENRVFSITANRVGKEERAHGDLHFTGKSQLITPAGAVVHRATAQQEEVYITEIDPRQAEDKFITKYNNLLTDRRPEFYFD